MATIEQRAQDRLGLNPSLQNQVVTGTEYYYHLFGGRRWYFGTGSPSGVISAFPGDVAITDEGMFICNGDGSGGTGTAWFSSSNSPLTGTCEANTELVITHTLKHVANVWAVNAAGAFMDIEVYDVTIAGFKVKSYGAGTIYYR